MQGDIHVRRSLTDNVNGTKTTNPRGAGDMAWLSLGCPPVEEVGWIGIGPSILAYVTYIR